MMNAIGDWGIDHFCGPPPELGDDCLNLERQNFGRFVVYFIVPG
jgi:hypothetical protein